MFGKGLLKGLSVTGKEAISKRMTEKYPEEKPYLAACYRGGNFQLDVENCIGCCLCARACPNKAIEVVTEKNEEGKRYVKEYWIDRQYCLFCGLCIEACNKNAIRFTLDFETAVYSRFDVPINLIENPNLDKKSSVYGLKQLKQATKKVVKKTEPVEYCDSADKKQPETDKSQSETPVAEAEKGVE